MAERTMAVNRGYIPPGPGHPFHTGKVLSNVKPMTASKSRPPRSPDAKTPEEKGTSQPDGTHGGTRNRGPNFQNPRAIHGRMLHWPGLAGGA
jgi:hypothetical protein